MLCAVIVLYLEQHYLFFFQPTYTSIFMRKQFICTGKLVRRMVSSGMLHHVALVKTGVSEELSASFIRLTRIGELGTTLAVTSIVPSSSILVNLMKEALSSSETSVLRRAPRRNIPEDTILHCWYIIQVIIVYHLTLR
jgi:hypothetical protein